MSVKDNVPASELAFYRIEAVRISQRLSGRKFAMKYDYDPSMHYQWSLVKRVPTELVDKVAAEVGLPQFYFFMSDDEAARYFGDIEVQRQQVKEFDEAKKASRTLVRLVERMQNQLTESISQSDFVPIKKMVRLPVLPGVPASEFSANLAEVTEFIDLPEELVGDGQALVPVMGECMFPTLRNGDRVIVQFTEDATEGKVVIARTPDGQYTLKRLVIENHRRILKPDNPEFLPVTAEEAKIVAQVVGLYREL